MGLESFVNGLLSHNFGKYLLVLLSFPHSLKPINGLAEHCNLRTISSIFQALHYIGPLHDKSKKVLGIPVVTTSMSAF